MHLHAGGRLKAAVWRPASWAATGGEDQVCTAGVSRMSHSIQTQLFVSSSSLTLPLLFNYAQASLLVSSLFIYSSTFRHQSCCCWGFLCSPGGAMKQLATCVLVFLPPPPTPPPLSVSSASQRKRRRANSQGDGALSNPLLSALWNSTTLFCCRRCPGAGWTNTTL